MSIMDGYGSNLRWRRETPALFLLLAIFLFNALTLRQGHYWGDDFALYVHEGENIAQSQPLGDTGYVYNAREAYYGPRVYPPVFPALLAPVIRWRGLDFPAMKMVEVVSWTIALTAVYLIFRDLRPGYRLLLVVLLGFNPVLWDMKDSVVSDYPFLCFFLISILLIERTPRTGRAGAFWGVITGLAIYLSYGTRSVGVVLICGLVIYEVVKKRILSWYLVSALCSCGILIVSQHYLFGSSESSYADQFRLSLQTLQTNVHDYSAVLASFWPPITGLIFSHVMFAAVTGLAIYGMVQCFRWRAIRPLEATLAVYFPIILLWPGNQGMRFLLPVLPLYLAYALLGAAKLSQRWRPAFRGALPLALALVVLLVYAVDYRSRNFGTIHEAYGLPTFNDMCRYVRQNSSRQDTFVFYRARALSLFTDRPASIYFIDSQPSGKDREEQWKYFQQIHSRFIVCSRLFEADRKLLTPVIKEHSSALREVYHNTDFVVYRLDKKERGRNR